MRLPPLARCAGGAILVAAAAPLLLALALRYSPSIELRLGPGDRDYARGFAERFRFDGKTSWRSLAGAGRASLPLYVEGGGTLSLLTRRAGDSPSTLTVRFDDGTPASVSVPRGNEPASLRFQVPSTRTRAVVRVRAEGGIDVGSFRWQPRRAYPDRSLALSAALFGGFSFLALAVAGLSPPRALATLAPAFAALALLSRLDAFAAIHLVDRLAWAAGLGVVLVAFSRLAARSAAPRFRGLLYAALLFKSALLFHPDFYFVDWPIHETLLELLYHRGPLDFRNRLVDYQLAHNVGVASVGGEARAFPYPVLFYYTAHLGNRFHHAPELWLKLAGALFATLALLPLGYLARRLSSRPHADTFAAAAYLLVPSLTRSLLLLELSAVAGCALDLLAVATLAALELKLDRARTFALAVLTMSLSLAAYTAGFVHVGLLVGCVLILGLRWRRPDTGSWTAKDSLRLALAGWLALGLGLLAYHPKAVLSLAAAVIEKPAQAPSAPAPADLLESAFARARTFLGGPLIAAGALGLGLALRRLAPSPLRLLFAAWALSALLAYGLRYAFIDLFQYQKELYWAGALFALGAGALVSFSRSRALRAAMIAALLASYALELRTMVEQFFRSYLFL